MTAVARTRFPWGFAAASGAIYAVALWIATILHTIDNPEWVAAGMTLDLVVLVPGLYWLTCVRRRGWPGISVVPVVVVSVLLASWIVPASHRGALTIVEYAIVPLELGLVGFVAWKVRRAYLLYRSSRDRNARFDAVDAIRAAVAGVVPYPAAARAASYELSILYLALFGWRAKPDRDDSRQFTCYRDSSYGILLGALMMVLILELVGVHVALLLWVGPTIAWIVTALTLYTALWMIGDFQALRLRPIVIEAERLRLRVGLRWEADVPLSAIRSVEAPDAAAGPGLKMAILGEPGVSLGLTREIPVSGIYGMRRSASRVLLAVDSPERFREALAARLEDGSSAGRG